MRYRVHRYILKMPKVPEEERWMILDRRTMMCAGSFDDPLDALHACGIMNMNPNSEEEGICEEVGEPLLA